LPEEVVLNSLGYSIEKNVGRTIYAQNVNITGTGSLTVNFFQVTGTVLIIDQYAELTSVTTLTNCTDVYATAYDGTNTVQLTKTPGAVLSNAPVGSFFTKNRVASETYTVLLADQVRVDEPTLKIAQPFHVVQKNGADTFIRFHLTTTDNPIDFNMDVWFWYVGINGGDLTLLV
jgi:hypothetical protein